MRLLISTFLKIKFCMQRIAVIIDVVFAPLLHLNKFQQSFVKSCFDFFISWVHQNETFQFYDFL